MFKTHLVSTTCIVLATLSMSCQANSQTLAETSKSKGLEVNSQPLPHPLTLSVLLKNYAKQSPAIAQQLSNIDLAKATLDSNQVNNAWQVGIQGRLGQREYANEAKDYNLLALHVSKVLYDFDRTTHQHQADQELVAQQENLLKIVSNKQKLNIVKAFLNVLLADFQYRIDNEAMAIEYVSFDKIKDKQAIGQLSDVDLLAAEQTYQQALVKRMRAEQAQLQTRIELANVLGLPNERPDELSFPDLSVFKTRTIKDVRVEQLQKQVLDANEQLQALEKAKKAQLYRLQAAKKTSSPTIKADAWAGQLSSYPEIREGRWKATLSVDIPLLDGGSTKSATAQARAKLASIQAQQQELKQSLRTQVTDIYFQLKLLAAEKKQNQAFGDYADLYLDYSRALYENESSTDLGDAMVRLSEANYQMVAWQFKQALLWLQLDFLLGKPISLEPTKRIALAQPSSNTQ